MTNNTNPQPLELEQDIFLRVAPKSELGLMVSKLMGADKPVAGSDLLDEVGKAKAVKTLRYLTNQFDNFRVNWTGNEKDTYTLDYVDVVGRSQTVVNVQQAEFAGTGGEATTAETFQQQLVWPNAPRVLSLEDYSWYRKPSWYKRATYMMTERGKHLALEGAPSVGKDSFIEYLSAEQEVPLVQAPADGGLRKRDLIGSMEMVNGTTVFQVADFAAAVVNGWWAVVSEVNAADPDVLLLLNSLMAAPYVITIHGRTYPVHSNFRLIITFNNGLVGTKPLPQSTRDRFFSIRVPWFTENELTERLLAHGMQPLPDYAQELAWQQLIVQTGLKLWEAHENGHLRYQITFRRLLDAVILVQDLETDVKLALRNSVMDAVDAMDDRKKVGKLINEVCTPSEPQSSGW